MERLLTAAQMKACDARSVQEIGIPSPVLMERAALATVEEMKQAGLNLSRVLVICGSGNNGGDGFAIARILTEEGESDVTVAFVGREGSMTEETALQKKICENSGVKISSNFMKGEYTVIVDAIFGIGLSRTVQGYYAEVIRWINRQGIKVVAVDIPSGVCADDGQILGIAVKADLTVTFACRKVGQILYPGTLYCGRLVRRNIGIRTDFSDAFCGCSKTGISACQTPVLKPAYDASSVFTYTDQDLGNIPERRPDSHKGTCGKVLLIAGSEGMSGAAVLAAKGALRSGCGMVRIFTPECNRIILQTALPEAIVSTWEPQMMDVAVERLRDALLWADVAGIGPGLGTSREAELLLTFVLQNMENPLVIDADALNLLSMRRKHCLHLTEEPSGFNADDHAGSGLWGAVTDALRGKIVITPHIGEMAKLTGKNSKTITAAPIASAEEFSASHGVVCALKSARTIVSDGTHTCLNTSGNDGMATAGSGDVLTGVICALLAQKMSCFDAASLGVYIHGRAGDLAREELGAYGMLAGDMADRIGEVMQLLIDGKRTGGGFKTEENE